MNREIIPLISWGWSEGRVWDNWMIIHFFSGMVAAGVLMLAGTSFSYASLITLVVLTLWEFTEMAFGIHEETEDIVLDIVFGMLGFFAFSEYCAPFLISSYVGPITLGLFSVTSLGAFLGWRARMRRETIGSDR